MKPIEFPEQTTIIAENQPEYENLPAHFVKDDPHGTIICCIELSQEEREKVMTTGKIWLNMLTFGRDIQPILLTADKPEML